MTMCPLVRPSAPTLRKRQRNAFTISDKIKRLVLLGAVVCVGISLQLLMASSTTFSSEAIDFSGGWDALRLSDGISSRRATGMANETMVQPDDQAAPQSRGWTNPASNSKPKKYIPRNVPKSKVDPNAVFSSVPIRKWGCARNETPFIFVHVGKAGGGTVRRRLASSARNYTKRVPYAVRQEGPKAARNFWKNVPGAYYPVGHLNGTTGYVRGKFVSSKHRQFWPIKKFPSAFENQLMCPARTPLGQAIGCPMPREMSRCDTERCPIVYAGHNLVGSEMHWLPQKYLVSWWEKMGKSFGVDNESSTWIHDGLSRRMTSAWCRRYTELKRTELGVRLGPYQIYTLTYPSCVSQLATKADHMANIAHPSNDWSSMYSSLPIIRATIARDPFSWMMSKFFWHSVNEHANCTDIEKAVGDLSEKVYGAGHIIDLAGYSVGPESNKTKGPEYDGTGWLRGLAMQYILYLCGEDCAARLQNNPKIQLDELLRQADRNLRQSFAVVGILEETDEFFDMLSARVHYMDLTMKGNMRNSRHSSKKTPEAKRCRAAYADADFQARILEVAPEMAGLKRLYETAIEVNQAHLEELRTCPGTRKPSSVMPPPGETHQEPEVLPFPLINTQMSA